jgi:hypothetical protein
MKKITVAIACLMVLAGVSWADDMENAGNEAKYYDNAKVVRIKNIEGEGFVQRSYDEGDEEATPNLPLFEKDTVGTTAGRLGIYLGRLNYLRLDADTTVQLLGVPQLRRTDLIARVERGAIYLDIENLDNEKGIEIQTPDCGVFLLDKGIYRVNVDENSLTEVFVIEGIAEVAGQSGSRNVRENQKIVMARGQIEERPYYFYASEKDDFDRWNESQNREQGYARYGTSRYLQSGYEDYEYEMSRSGNWTFMPEFNSYVWAPYYSNADWMPYGNGRWVYNPFYGYVWVSYDRCGWFTHHYGRWHWSYGSGWYWIPSYHWSPAWVSWFWDNDYYGWCPLSWWGQPVIVINNHWDRHYDYRHGIPCQSRSTIIIRKNELTAVNAAKAAIRKNNFGPTGSSRLIAYHGTAPNERPTVAQISVINARGRTVAYKQNGIVSKEKYRAGNEAAETGKSTVYRYNGSGNDSTYSPRVYNKKEEEKGSKTYNGGYSSSSKTSRESSGSTSSSETARSKESKHDDSSSSSKSSSSDNSARARDQATTSSQSSSSTSSEAREVKKKKDEAAYMALLRSENTAGYKSHATGIASNSTPVDTGVSNANRPAYRSYTSRTDSAAGNFGMDRKSSRTVGSNKAVAADSGYRPNGYSYPSGFAADHAASARSLNRTFSTEYASGRSYASSSSHGSESVSSGRARSSGFTGSSSASSNHSSHASVSTRSWGGSSSSSSHSSSGSTAKAKKQ